MDTITQVVLGATIAEAGFRRKLGKKSILFGALCGWLPDIDIFFHSGGWEEMVAHRGLTHSILFLPLIAPIIGEIAHRVDGKKGSRRAWVMLAFWALITHPLLDWNTSYGTQLLYPLSSHRFSTDSIAIIDLFYTIPLIFAVFLACRNKVDRQRSRKTAQKALVVSTLYLVMAFAITQVSISRVKKELAKNDFHAVKIRSNPPPLFSPLRRVVAIDEQGRIAISIAHILQSTPQIEQKPMPVTKQAASLLQTKEGEIFSWYTDGIMVFEEHPDRIIIRAPQYGLFKDIWSSPFSAQAFRTTEGMGRLELLPRTQEIDMAAELRIGLKKTFLME